MLWLLSSRRLNVGVALPRRVTNAAFDTLVDTLNERTLASGDSWHEPPAADNPVLSRAQTATQTPEIRNG
jgi:hypothetical protein